MGAWLCPCSDGWVSQLPQPCTQQKSQALRFTSKEN